MCFCVFAYLGSRFPTFHTRIFKQTSISFSYSSTNAERALWFAETYDLLPISLTMSDKDGGEHVVSLNRQAQQKPPNAQPEGNGMSR